MAPGRLSRLFSLLTLPTHINLLGLHLIREVGGRFFDALIPIRWTEIEAVSKTAKAQRDSLQPSTTRPPVAENQ